MGTIRNRFQIFLTSFYTLGNEVVSFCCPFSMLFHLQLQKIQYFFFKFNWTSELFNFTLFKFLSGKIPKFMKFFIKLQDQRSFIVIRADLQLRTSFLRSPLPLLYGKFSEMVFHDLESRIDSILFG